MKLLPTGTRIRFILNLDEPASETEPAVHFASAGDIGKIVGHDAKEHYQVIVEGRLAWFGAKRSEFEPIKP